MRVKNGKMIKKKAESACDGGLVHILFIEKDGREARMSADEREGNEAELRVDFLLHHLLPSPIPDWTALLEKGRWFC